ncbi:MAG: aspartate carbamoyltransferase [Acidobacteriota bacterium]
MPLSHVVESQQFTLPLLQELFQRSRGMERVVARGGTQEFRDRIMATLFYEPSTRTRLSFEAAMHRLGGRVLSTEHARAFSSEVSGEQLEDTIRTIGGITDTIVLRHTEQDGATRAAAVSPVPIINAGDGNGGQHPTQALLDLYTIWRDRGALDGLSIAMVGELDQGRTVRSLSYLLSKFDRVKIHFVSPPEVQMQPDILEHLDRHGTCYELQPELAKVISDVDVLYLTRIKPDRVRERASLSRYTVGAETVRRMKPDALILHPLPRTVELDSAVDRDPRARYFQQATNGLFVRMALLTMLFDEP